MIRLLEKNVADKIAAGEVVERPVSIVKELVENSIDSGATWILVDIHDGGKTYIRVSDNGSGIEEDQVETAFLRHATSKIWSVKDLDSIDTLGFRGEALASICAVTRTEMTTATEEGKPGTHLTIHGSQVIDKKKVGASKGTTIVIEDLFYNTPAREKFLKSSATESKKVIELISHIALTRPDIKFKLMSNGKNVFTTAGKGDLLNTILQIFPQPEYKNLLEINSEINGIRVYGYISKPSLNRNSRKDIFTVVNGRVVKSKVIEKGLLKGYKERLFEGRYPVAFLFLEVNPETLDVNIHPNKKEIRFDNDKIIEDVISQITVEALQSMEGVITFHDTKKYEAIEKEAKKLAEKEAEKVDTKKVKKEDVNESLFDNLTEDHRIEENHLSYNTSKQIDLVKALAQKREEKEASKVISQNMEKNEVNTVSNLSNNGEIKENVEITSLDTEVQDQEKSFANIEITRPSKVPFDFINVKFKTVIFDTYIIAEEGDSFFIIDQHAAHERVFYEKLVGEYNQAEKNSQMLIAPFTYDLPFGLVELQERWKAILENMGYEVEAFGYNTYRIMGIPQFMTIPEAKEFIDGFTLDFSEDDNLENYIVIDKLITKSCKRAIKAHDRVTEPEAMELIAQLKECRNPFSCPHGRPTFLKFSNYEIERMFKRT